MPPLPEIGMQGGALSMSKMDLSVPNVGARMISTEKGQILSIFSHFQGDQWADWVAYRFFLTI
jgi:hypothetical protein